VLKVLKSPKRKNPPTPPPEKNLAIMEREARQVGQRQARTAKQEQREQREQEDRESTDHGEEQSGKAKEE